MMDLVTSSPFEAFEQTVLCSDPESGTTCFTVFHDTGSGPAVGSFLLLPAVEDEHALAEARRHARAETAKAVLAGLPFAGGCTVLRGAGEGGRPPSLLRAFGRLLADLGGRYCLASGPCLSPGELGRVGQETDHVVGRRPASVEDRVLATATGVWLGLKAAVRHRLAKDSLQGLRIALLGLDPVGDRLADLLRRDGAKLTVADRNAARNERVVQRLGVRCMTRAELLTADCDILVPCSGRGVIDGQSLPNLACSIVAGAADGQLESPEQAAGLQRRGILHAPEPVINAGGLIHLAEELSAGSYSWQRAMKGLDGIAVRLERIFAESMRDGAAPSSITALELEAALAAGARPETAPLRAVG
jgi:leucine dehydrogenase